MTITASASTIGEAIALLGSTELTQDVTITGIGDDPNSQYELISRASNSSTLTLVGTRTIVTSAFTGTGMTLSVVTPRGGAGTGVYQLAATVGGANPNLTSLGWAHHGAAIQMTSNPNVCGWITKDLGSGQFKATFVDQSTFTSVDPTPGACDAYTCSRVGGLHATQRNFGGLLVLQDFNVLGGAALAGDGNLWVVGCRLGATGSAITIRNQIAKGANDVGLIGCALENVGGTPTLYGGIIMVAVSAYGGLNILGSPVVSIQGDLHVLNGTLSVGDPGHNFGDGMLDVSGWGNVTVEDWTSGAGLQALMGSRLLAYGPMTLLNSGTVPVGVRIDAGAQILLSSNNFRPVVSTGTYTTAAHQVGGTQKTDAQMAAIITGANTGVLDGSGARIWVNP